MDALIQLFSEFGYLLFNLIPVILIGAVAVFLEYRFPRRDTQIDGLRWMVGAALTSMAWLLAIIAVPVTGVISAAVADAAGAGLLNYLDVPAWLAIVVGFLVFDSLGYAFHRLLHEVPLFWRLHRVHHSESDVDASTALKVHPAEPLFGSVLVILVTVSIGVPAESILLHFLFMQVFNFWHHANIRAFPGQRRLGVLFNIPEFHEVHHSVARDHHNTNYGSVLSVWDRMFGTLTDDPDLFGKVEFGLNKDYWDHPSTFTSLMIDPIRK